MFLFEDVLTDETLRTFLTEAKRILNNRPLLKMTDDPGILETATTDKLLLTYKGLSFDDVSAGGTLLKEDGRKRRG